jgi:hypothetical protein
MYGIKEGAFIILSVITGTPREPMPPAQKPDYIHLHLCAMANAIEKYYASNEKSDLFKIINHGVRLTVLLERNKDSGEHDNLLQHIDTLIHTMKAYISMLTPRELTQIFPIKKTYDGEKYQIKDYFSTMKALEEYGLDRLIGDSIDDVLWDYDNFYIMEFYVAFLCATSRRYKEVTGKGIMEEWAEENGIDPLYKGHDKRSKKDFLYNPRTQRTSAYKQSLLPKGWKVFGNTSELHRSGYNQF